MKLIPLVTRKNIRLETKHAIVDDEDYDWFTQWDWYANELRPGKFYVRRSASMEYLHREVICVPKGKQVDHINGNPLDNRKANLRLCNNEQNNSNKKKYPGKNNYKGTHLHKKSKKWLAKIKVKNKDIYLGSFDNEIDAAKAYNAAAIKYRGEFAYLNHVG